MRQKKPCACFGARAGDEAGGDLHGVRHAVLIEGISERAAAERFGINARTVSKMQRFSVPPGYVRTKPPFRPKLDAFVGIIATILAADKVVP